MKTKVCSKCGVEKPFEEFYNDKNKKDGLRTQCKSCENEQKAKYRDTQRDRINRKNKIYRAKNKKSISCYNKYYNKINRDKKREHWNKYFIKNRDKILKRKLEVESKKVIEMSESYILKLICNGTDLSKYEIPKEIIELKRVLIKTHRIINKRRKQNG